MKAIDYLTSLIAGQKMGSSIPVQVCELEMLKTYLEIQQTMAEGRAALANAELVEDVERYRWLRDYLISPSTHFDDLIVSADKADTLDGVIDAARAKGAK